MKFLLCLPFIALLSISCSSTNTPERRIAASPQPYQPLGENEKALVRAGQISNGMSKSAVWLAWGEPAGKSYGQSGRARTEQWIYRSYQPVYTQSFYGSNYGHYYDCGYGYSGLGFGLGVNYVPVPSAKVDFENDRVVAWARGDRR